MATVLEVRRLTTHYAASANRCDTHFCSWHLCERNKSMNDFNLDAKREKAANFFEFREVPQCNACQSLRQRTLGFRGGSAHRSGAGVRTRIVACRDCGLIFPNPMPLPLDRAALYDTAAEVYFRHHDLDLKRKRAAKLLQELETKTSGRRLLEVGCGQGALLDAAHQGGWHPEGLDISERFAQFARDKLGVPVRVGDVSSVHISPESFDVVVLNAILEHLPDPRRVLMKMHRALKPGGLIWIDVPNERGLYYRMGNLWNRLRGRDWVVNLSPTFSPGHLYGFSPKSLGALLRRNGFLTLSIQGYQGVNCLPPPRTAVEALERVGVEATLHVAQVFGLGDGMICLGTKAE